MEYFVFFFGCIWGRGGSLCNKGPGSSRLRICVFLSFLGGGGGGTQGPHTDLLLLPFSLISQELRSFRQSFYKFPNFYGKGGGADICKLNSRSYRWTTFAFFGCV